MKTETKPSKAALAAAEELLSEWQIGTASQFCDEVDFDSASAEEIAAIIDKYFSRQAEALNFIANLIGPNGERLYEGGCQSIAQHALARAGKEQE
jgi:hypothetical protein